MNERRGVTLLCAVALAAGLFYIVVTPPVRVPDELGHFLRSVAIGEGDPFPRPGSMARLHQFPLGVRMFLHRIGKESDPEARYEWADLRAAHAEGLNRKRRTPMEFPAWYTPAPYAVTALVAFAGIQTNVRPIWIFYAGRVANLLAALAIITLALRLQRRGTLVIAAVMLLPMTIYELSSWSADAMTIAVAFLLTALILRSIDAEGLITAGEVAALAGVALLSGLCKPAYFLLVLPVVLIATTRFRTRSHRIAVIVAVLGSMALGTLLSVLAARAGHYHPRRDLPVDPQQQMDCVRREPVQFVRVALNDMRVNGRSYLDQTIGRFGWMNVPLPVSIVVVQWFLLLWIGMTCGVRWSVVRRIVVIVSCAGIIAGISLSQYLVWSIICGDTIEGIQGRYYLPVLPLLLFAIAHPRFQRRPSLLAVGIIGVASNAIALAILWRTFWV